MPSISLPMPTKDQCYALSDEQCRKIQERRDPGGVRVNSDWEPAYQVELLRHYMAMLSFKQIEDAMKSRLDWSYKTYQNRYRDWKFPLDRIERELVVRELFAWISSQNDYTPPRTTTPFQSRPFVRPLQPLPTPQHTPQHTPLLPSQPSTPLAPEPQVIPQDFFLPPHMRNAGFQTHSQNRMSVATIATSASGSSQSSRSYWDDSRSSHRASIATTNSSLSSGSYFFTATQPRAPKAPKHDSIAGLWNNVLRVIPCGKDHSDLLWDQPFNNCPVCGFSRWHSLMVHAGSIGIDNFVAAMTVLRDVPRVDFAGNHPIHYLMSAGVGLDFFSSPFQWGDNFPQNVFGQNPLHALNPLGLGENLISFLEWFSSRENPPGLLLMQRDIYCRTPLHTILQFPLDREMYQKILNVFPLAELYLNALDTNGSNTVNMMNKAAMRIQLESPSDYSKIQDGITEIKPYLSDAGRRTYGFHDIARGARGTSNRLFGWYECKICNRMNAHSNSYLDQLSCALVNGRDRNGPDETGMTPAHALVTLARCNDDEERTPETPKQTAELFRFLIPSDDSRRSEALHALDPEGRNLVYNIATRGLDEILEYVLQLVHRSRRSAMVNACSKGPNGNDCSVLMATKTNLDEAMKQMHIAEVTKNMVLKAIIKDKAKRLYRCKTLLQRAGAEMEPSVTTRWRIS